MEYKDYYKILGVKRDAGEDEIKRAYRKLARKYHPDVSKEKDAEQKFKVVNEANEVLRDPEKRRAYDQLGADWRAGQEFRPPPGWQWRETPGGHTQGFSEEFTAGGGFSDFFESLFGGRFRQGGQGPTMGGRGFRRGAAAEFSAPGMDREAGIEITLEEAYHGGRRSLRLDGRTLTVKIPAGVQAGQRIRLAGQGEPGIGRGPNGDLYLEIGIRPHPRYRLEARDVTLDLPITPWEAALGATVTVPTLGGRVELRVPKGSQSGRRLRLKGRGLPGKPPGDQYVVLQINTPPAGNDTAREFYRRMEEEMPFDPRDKF